MYEMSSFPSLYSMTTSCLQTMNQHVNSNDVPPWICLRADTCTFFLYMYVSKRGHNGYDQKRLTWDTHHSQQRVTWSLWSAVRDNWRTAYIVQTWGARHSLNQMMYKLKEHDNLQVRSDDVQVVNFVFAIKLSPGLISQGSNICMCKLWENYTYIPCAFNFIAFATCRLFSNLPIVREIKKV